MIITLQGMSEIISNIWLAYCVLRTTWDNEMTVQWTMNSCIWLVNTSLLPIANTCMYQNQKETEITLVGCHFYCSQYFYFGISAVLFFNVKTLQFINFSVFLCWTLIWCRWICHMLRTFYKACILASLWVYPASIGDNMCMW